MTSSGLQEAVEPCENCYTGPGQCKVNQTCQAAVITNGTATNIVFAEESSNVELVANEKDCFVDLDVVAIGGGGNYVDNTYGGAGSGYVEAAKIRLSIKDPLMKVTVGSAGGPSMVEVGEEVLLEAAPGEGPDSVKGGDGYCGGGGLGGSARGGSDGGDGEDGTDTAGGSGSGLNLDLLSMKSFILTPGGGGDPGSSSHGGGGGGVIVNGKIPGDNQYMGKGYGGGAADFSNADKGYPGCVLVAR